MPNSFLPGDAGRIRGHRSQCRATRRALTLRHRLRALCARDFVIPIVIAALVLVSAFVPQSPLRDAATRGNVSGVRLAIGGEYALLAPFCALLDMQSILTIPQHLSVLVTLLVCFCIWRAIACNRSASFPVWRRELGRLLLFVIVAPVLLLLVNVLVPRPMARLQVDDPDVVAVDVHTHTASSHDGRPDWTQARVRNWHRASGYDVAYITDHKRFGGAIDALATNPARAGDGVVLLSGLELRSGGQHVNVLSMTPAESTYIVDGDHLTRAIRLREGRAPLIVQTIPFTLSRFAGPGQDTLPITRAIELNDGAPRGLTTGLNLHAELLHLADSLNLALVAGSDNHGWGNTASGWTLVRVPGWRDLTPDALAVRLETAMLGGRHATSVVERRTPLLFGVPQLALTIPAMFVSAARGLTLLERISWIAWSWTSLLVRLGVRRAAVLSLGRARLARRRRRERMRIVPIRPAVGVQS